MKFPEADIDYTQQREYSALICDQPIRFFSKPGLPEWDRISPSARLLAENAHLPANARALLLGCGHGAAAAALSRRIPGGELYLMDHNFIALQMSAQTLHANQASNAHVHSGLSLLPEHGDTFDAVLIDLPKGRQLARRWLVEAHALLRPAGALYLAGANDHGIRSAANDAQALFGNAAVLAYKKGNRLLRLVKEAAHEQIPAWRHEPGIAPGSWRTLQIDAPQGVYNLRSLPGVFSFDRLDEGTRLLLSGLEISPGDKMIDLGCGYGIIGLVAALSGAGQVDLLDVNLLATACANENLALHNVSNARAYPSDVLSAAPQARYSLVASNPPFHSGAAVDYQIAAAFIRQSWGALEKGGRLLLVANRFIRYDRLLEQVFGQARCLAQTGRYHLLLAIR
ncbi:MAG: class I SAM-dependent methyltransferase [Anaerolineales bacterium]|nr:class I SAM-dependent methyltransferase [Anaerolineales bacterium]